MSVCQFVDSISASATIRLDLDVFPWSLQARDTNTPPPEMRRIISNTYISDGASIPVTTYDNRVITLGLQIDTDAPTAATQLQRLNVELDRETNILRWQPDLRLPAQYFRTFRSPDYVQDIEYGVGVYNFTVTMSAEPFGLGLETAITTATINNDPGAGTNRLFADITGILGDVPTPLYARTTTSLAGFSCLLASRRRGTPGNNTWFVQAESVTQGTDTAATGTTDALASPGTGLNYSICTFATQTTEADRIQFTLPSATASAELRGTYRVYARMRKSAVGSVMTARLNFASSGIKNTVVTVPDSTTWALVDLGLIDIPVSSQTLQDGYGAALGALGVIAAVRCARTSGTGSLYFDYVLFAPADTEMAVVKWPASPAGPAWVFDGPNDDCYWRGTAGVNHNVGASAGSSPDYAGGLPMVAPNVTNRIFFVVLDAPISQATALTWSYWPRYLNMRPVST